MSAAKRAAELTEQQVRDRLQEMCDLAGGQRAFARVQGIAETAVSDCLHVRRAGISPAILRALGLRKVTRFALARNSNSSQIGGA
ncbi:hypothetical protein BKE38_04000 [Pseudoroseomonas deserti]|uniref:Uncharacterized protein n=1 Tax=Teichococcus deserti TaxID=1817963 RepID=A0A1V2H6P8_9PROT|nr:hypothetical protein [Pseudoroseomonas deserti]ONG57322.1 hypothetical protein BKE38_04000 [Pseudoroseomonas deserti]